MDLVDIARAVFRWWYVVLMLLALGAVLAVGLAGTVEPTYEVESQVLFVGPQRAPIEVDPETGEGTDPNNPYLMFSGSLEVTSEAVARRVDGAEFRKQVSDEGFTGEFVFEGGSTGTPLITTLATADTPEEAQDLMGRVIEGLGVTLRDLQDDANVKVDEQITMRTLTVSDPQKLIGGRNRVLIGVLAVTALSAVAVAVLLESIQTRRSRRESEPPPDDPTRRASAGGRPLDGPSSSNGGESERRTDPLRSRPGLR